MLRFHPRKPISLGDHGNNINRSGNHSLLQGSEIKQLDRVETGQPANY